MSNKSIANIPKLLAFARIQQQEDVLVLGDGNDKLASRIKNFVGHRRVVAVSRDGADTNFPTDPLRYVVVLKGDMAQIVQQLARCEVYRQGFQLIICVGHPDLLSATVLPSFLHLWSKHLARGGRFVLEIHRSYDGQELRESWSKTELRYSEAALKARFRMAEINGIERDDTFPITYADISARILSTRLTAKFIEETDTTEANMEAGMLRLTADVWQDRLSNAITELERPGYDPIASLVERTLDGQHKLYGTFRRS